MKRSLIALFAILGYTLTTSAQSYSMMPDPDAKSMSMGGVMMTTLSSSHGLYGNAASVLFTHTPLQISSSYYHQEEYNYYVVSGHYILDGRNAVQLGWRQLRRPDQKDMAVDANYSRRIGERWSVGLTARYYRYTFPQGANNALAADLSAMYVLPLPLAERSELRAGARLANMGAWLDGPGDALPVNVSAGAALDTFVSDAHEITVGVDCAYYADSGFIRGGQASVGIEYNLMQLFQVRGGYHIGGNSYHNPNYASVGAGVRFMHLRLDFAYLFAKKNTPLHNTYSISFGLDL